MEVLDIILKWAIPFVCTAVASACITWVKTTRSKAKAQEEKSDLEFQFLKTGLQALLRAEILRSHDKYTQKGYCPIYAREALDKTYSAYHGLGGNDVATDLYHHIKSLPSTEPIETETIVPRFNAEE